MKTKIATLLGIAIVLCSLFLVATLPATAIEQSQTTQKVSAPGGVTTASEDDYVLDIYGNANEDDTVDMRDLTYVKLIFFGKKPETELADAKYDGEINPLDFVQIKLIIVGKEKELTLIDSTGRIVTVKKPVKRIISLSVDVAELLRSIGVNDKIVAVDTRVKEQQLFFPELSKLPSIGKAYDPDLEAILELRPDIIICQMRSPKPDKLEDKLTFAVARFEADEPELMNEELRKLGYIFDKKKEAEVLIDFYESVLSKIKERISKLEESEKPRVYLEFPSKYKSVCTDVSWHETCIMAGGINIAADLCEGYGFPKVDPEWVMKQNPDVIIKSVYRTSVPCGYGVNDPSEMKAAQGEIMNRPELAKVTAVKNGAVYVMASWEIVDAPGYFVGVAYQAKWLHPELFEDLDPKAIHKEYLERFQGVPYRGVYAYPEPS